MPGIWMSSTYVAVPVMSRGSSRRRMRLPTRVSVLVMVVAMLVSSGSCLGCRGFHRVDDVLVAGATTEIAFEAVPDLFFGRVGIPLEQLSRGHDHTGRAEAALEAVLVPERFLDWMQVPVGGQTLDGGELAPIGLHGEHGAGFHHFSVDRHRAGAANGGFAADVRPGKAGDLAQIVNEKHARLDLVRIGFPVDLECNFSFHGISCLLPVYDVDAKRCENQVARRVKCEAVDLNRALGRRAPEVRCGGRWPSLRLNLCQTPVRSRAVLTDNPTIDARSAAARAASGVISGKSSG